MTAKLTFLEVRLRGKRRWSPPWHGQGGSHHSSTGRAVVITAAWAGRQLSQQHGQGAPKAHMVKAAECDVSLR